jgi:nicotinamide riboside kinase
MIALRYEQTTLSRMTHLLITTGPESCGKTTLASALSTLLRAPLVGEVAREYLTLRYRNDPLYQYQPQDLLAIAKLQHEAEQHALLSRPELLVCDTDLLVLIVWSEVRYGTADPWMLETFQASLPQQQRTYLLCDYDIPWQPDPLREHQDSRDQLFARYLAKLQQWQLRHLIVRGTQQQRLSQVIGDSGPLCTNR